VLLPCRAHAFTLFPVFPWRVTYDQTDAEFIKLPGDFLNNADICHVFSGQEYCKFMQPGGFLSKDNPLNFSFSFSTDGVAHGMY